MLPIEYDFPPGLDITKPPPGGVLTSRLLYRGSRRDRPKTTEQTQAIRLLKRQNEHLRKLAEKEDAVYHHEGPIVKGLLKARETLRFLDGSYLALESGERSGWLVRK